MVHSLKIPDVSKPLDTPVALGSPWHPVESTRFLVGFSSDPKESDVCAVRVCACQLIGPEFFGCLPNFGPNKSARAAPALGAGDGHPSAPQVTKDSREHQACSQCLEHDSFLGRTNATRADCEFRWTLLTTGRQKGLPGQAAHGLEACSLASVGMAAHGLTSPRCCPGKKRESRSARPDQSLMPRPRKGRHSLRTSS